MGESKPEEQKEDKTTPTFKQKKPSKGSGLTISSSPGTNSGATISTYDGGETGAKETSNIYQDPNTGSTIATGEARKNISEGGDYKVVASTSSKTQTTKKTPTDKERPNMGFSSTGIGELESTIKTGNVLKTNYTREYDEAGYEMPDPVAEKQKEILKGPRPSKDLITGEDLKYSGPESTTSINKISPSLRRALLGGGMGSVLRRLSGLQPK
tara:strand:- start:12934 stop:13569 length:636 start_codon:yes stop_codon:yes gene_type:complete